MFRLTCKQALYCFLSLFLHSGVDCLAQPAATPTQLVKSHSEAARLLNAWAEQGKCAGFSSLYYDNRDNHHSPLNTSHYASLKVVETPTSTSSTGPNRPIGPPPVLDARPTVGNCSMAAAATKGGSWPRQILMHPNSADRGRGLNYLETAYRHNKLFVYPEHRDHDPGINGKNGYGDLFAANHPYLLISQGSSHSDRAFVDAALLTMAAFTPEVQNALIQSRWLVPTVQQILRQHYKGSPNYLSGLSHPVVFESAKLDVPAMLHRAQHMTLPTIPPQAVLSLIAPDELQQGEDLGTTSACIARVHRRKDQTYRIQLSGKESKSFTSKPLQYQWVVLQGNPNKVRLQPFGEKGQNASIEIDYHHRFRSSTTGLYTNRVDIALFCSEDGEQWSSPAFFCLFSMPDQQRSYDELGNLTNLYRPARHHFLELPPTKKIQKKYHPSLLGYGAFIGHLLEPNRAGTKPWRAFFQLLAQPTDEALRDKLHSSLPKLEKLSLTYHSLEKQREEQGVLEKAMRQQLAELDPASLEHDILKKKILQLNQRQKHSEQIQQEQLASCAQLVISSNLEQHVASVLQPLLSDPDFSDRHHTLLNDLLTPHAQAVLEKRKRHLATLPPSPADLLHRRLYNLDLIGRLFPDFLQQPEADNYIDHDQFRRALEE